LEDRMNGNARKVDWEAHSNINFHFQIAWRCDKG
jgi:hypothetical protein